jgi:hypothetical protein
MVSSLTATESECPDEKEAADTAKRAAAAANKALFKYRLVRPGAFKTENHFYPRVINSQIHPTVRFFMGLSQERIVERYCHMHPKVDRNVLMEVVKYRSEHFHWAGCDLMHTVNNAGEKKMVSWSMRAFFSAYHVTVILCVLSTVNSPRYHLPSIPPPPPPPPLKVLIETNSSPSGLKSTPLFDEMDEFGGYRQVLEKAFLPRVKESTIPNGKLAVLFDKNPMEASGYAAVLADLAKETVHLVPCFDKESLKRVRFVNGYMEILADEPTTRDMRSNSTASASDLGSLPRSSSGGSGGSDSPVVVVADDHSDDENVQYSPSGGRQRWIPIKGAVRYVTQRPWNRIPIDTPTVLMNGILPCLSGGRNKLVAAKAYDAFNVELAASGLQIQTPLTIRDVNWEDIPIWYERLGGFCAIKVPYSNAGQGVYTITSPEEFANFLEEAKGCPYSKFIVQSLVSNSSWSSAGVDGTPRLYHVGTVPDKNHDIYVADLRMMVSGGVNGFELVGIYARKTREPLAKVLEPGMDSWGMLGTNLSVKVSDSFYSSEPERLLLMDRRDFNVLGMGIDDLIDGFIQTVLAVVSIERMCKFLIPDGRFSLSLFKSVCDDEVLIGEIKEGIIAGKAATNGNSETLSGSKAQALISEFQKATGRR